MAKGRLDTAVRHVRDLVGAPPGDVSDRDLLDRFLARRDEAAFAALVRRHGAMVLGVCRGVLRHRHDAEDACQAAFLVLARKAASVRKREALASWLHGVAFRVARKLQAQRDRRGVRTGADVDVPQPDATESVTWSEVRAALHEELDRLPATYRAPLVLCYLEGKTQDEAARQLGWGRATLRGRLERGRHRLRARLLRRGVTLSAALCGAALGASRLPAGLVAATLRAGTRPAAVEAAGVVSPRVAALAEGVLKTMSRTRPGRVAGLLLAPGVLLAGLATLSYLLPAADAPRPGGAEQSPAPAAAREAADRLPPAWVPPLEPGVLEQSRSVAAGADAGTVTPGAPVFTFPVGGLTIKAAIDARRGATGGRRIGSRPLRFRAWAGDIRRRAGGPAPDAAAAGRRGGL